MAQQIPERLVNFKAYANGGPQLPGMVTVELPPFEAMKETISGAGIAGEVESIVVGHFASQKAKAKFRSVTREVLALLAPVYHSLDFRGAMQFQDPGAGRLYTQSVRFACRGSVHMLNPGKFEAGKQMDAEFEIECFSTAIWIAGVEIIHLDKLSEIYRVNGVDYLQKARVDMGGV